MKRVWCALATFAAFPTACGDSKEATPAAPASPSGSTVSAPAAAEGEPPPAPIAPRAGDVRKIFAVRTLLLGDAQPDGTLSESAWSDYAYNLDRHVTDRSSTDVCSLGPGATTRIQEDGPFGVDNSFGRTLLPVLSRMKGQSVSLETSDYMQSADALLLDVSGLDGSNEQTNTALTVSVLHAAKRVDSKGTPDRWSVDPESLKDGSSIDGGAKQVLANAYVSKGTFVARGATPLDVAIPMGAGELIRLRIHSPTITFRHVDGAAEEGRITGVLEPTALLPELQRGLKLWQPSTCTSDTELGFLAGMVEQSVDIQLDGGNGSGTTCAGISVGLGFRATETQVPSDVAKARAARTDPCK